MCIKLSVVIPTKNRQGILKNLVSSFIAQEIDYSMELIVVDQSPAKIDGVNLEVLGEIAEKIFNQCELRYHHTPHLTGLTQARNVGALHANGEIILFLDDDIILLPGFMKGIMEGFERGFDGVSGVQIQDTFDKGWIKEFYTNIFFRGYIRDKRRTINRKFYKCEPFLRTNVLSGGLTAYRKDMVVKYRFDENLVRYSLGEDKEFSMRASCLGAKLAICTRAIAYHMRHPAGRPDPYKRYEGKTAYIKYLQYKFSPLLKSKLRISTTWALIGTLLDAIINSVIKRSREPIRGALSGIRKSREGFKELEFIRIEEDSIHG